MNSKPSNSIDLGSIHYNSLAEVAGLIKTKQISPVDLTQIVLDRIQKLDPQLNSFATLMADQALAAAKKAENEIQMGNYRSALHGIPIAVKDLCYTHGVPTQAGLKVLAGFIPEYDATVISKLKYAGATLLGKLNLTEGAVGGYHRDFKIPVNPWRHDLWPGSSSSGSGVATAAGLCFGSLGSDTGGSIRFPAMANGIVGLKPSYGSVSRYGIFPLAESLDHVGPMTRTVADAAILFQAIAGFDSNDPTSQPTNFSNLLEEIEKDVKGIRIGYDAQYASTNVDSGLINAIEEALNVLEGQGTEIIPATMPDISEIRDIWRIICTYEAAKAHSAHYPSRAHQYGEFFSDFLEIGSQISDKDYHQAMEQRDMFSREFLETLDGVDAFICPGGGVPCPITPGFLYRGMKEIRSGLNQYTYFQFTIPSNFAGTPSLSLPGGISGLGVPYTFQIQGPLLSESLLCRIGHSYQQATGWHHLHPDI